MKKDPDDLEMGVIGSVSLLQNANLSTQPITSFDWSPDKVSRVDPENSERGARTLASYLNRSYLFCREFCSTGAHNPERAGPILDQYNGVFTNRFIFRYILEHFSPPKWNLRSVCERFERISYQKKEH